MQKYARVIASGSFLPKKRLTNQDLVEILSKHQVDTSDDWIVQRSGIRARHFAEEGELCSDLALQASVKALESANLTAQDIDMIVLATSTPDFIFPSTACLLQGKLQKKYGAWLCPAFDVQAVCSGFIYALSIAKAFIVSGQAQCALVVGSEVFSHIIDLKDRTASVLFGDGAGAVIVQASEEPGILSTFCQSDGSVAPILWVPGQLHGGQIYGDPFLRMDGPAVFKYAVKVLAEAAEKVLQKSGITKEQIDWVIPHQANIRIIQSVAHKLNIPFEKMIVTLHEHANTSAASIPLAWDVAIKGGQIKPGHYVLLEGVGGGFTWGSALLKM
ncbi:MAG: beta-ketoacyl-ACP synthase III [Gammaproteobacteria bacterium]|nr:beta-ketoacyl-ACP synthase III [Gammaproteobacteria bacterium]